LESLFIEDFHRDYNAKSIPETLFAEKFDPLCSLLQAQEDTLINGSFDRLCSCQNLSIL